MEKAKAERRAKLEKAFKVFDADGSGTLDSAEMMKILTRESGDCAGMKIEDAKEIIEAFDKNGDGVLNLEVRLPIRSSRPIRMPRCNSARRSTLALTLCQSRKASSARSSRSSRRVVRISLPPTALFKRMVSGRLTPTLLRNTSNT